MSQDSTMIVPGRAGALLPLVAALAALCIFLVDTFSPLGMAVAVLYVVVILMAVGFCERRGVIAIATGCAVLTLVSYALTHGAETPDSATVRLVVSLAAIGITTALALRNEAAMAAVREQAQLLDLTHDTIFVRDMADVIAYWNRGAEELYGWSRQEAVGRRAHELMRTVFPAPVEQINAELLRAGRWEGELVHTRRDGRRVTVASRWALQRDSRGRPIAILETNTDIDKRKRAEEALRRSEAYLAEAQKISRTGSFGWDFGNGEIFWSEQTFRLYGYDPSTVPTRELIVARIHESDRPAVVAAIEAAGTHARPIDIEHRLRLPDGGLRRVHVLADAARGPAGSVQLVGAIMDVTAVRAAEEALAEARIELAHATRMTTLGELTASIAHEVNQPLAAIVTNGEAGLRWLGRDEPDLGEVRKSVERMIGDARRASEVVVRLRRLSRKGATRALPVNLNEAIDDAIGLVQRELANADVRLDLRFAPALPEVTGDRIQLQQVVINLLINAVHAMATTPAAERSLTVETTADAADVVVRVVDSGIGLSAENLDRLFTAFFTTKPDGMGMGLSICRSIVEAHGGRIRAASNEGGRGATFEFRLPIVRENEA